MRTAIHKPYIVCAANRMPDGKLLVGVRHWDKLMHDQYDARYGDVHAKHSEVEQGFIDQWGKFYTREQALIAVESTGQTKGHYSKIELFSEDLYLYES